MIEAPVRTLKALVAAIESAGAAAEAAADDAAEARDVFDRVERRLRELYGPLLDEDAAEGIDRNLRLLSEIDIALGGSGVTNGCRNAGEEALAAALRLRSGEERRR